MPGSVVVIEELTGQRRKLFLSGSALPLQGASWSGETAMATEWNPGNREATQHVLNPKEMPSDWEFEWHTTRLIANPAQYVNENGSTQFISQAFDLSVLAESFCRNGMLLRVTWSSSAANESRPSARQVRIGRASTWDFAYDRADDLAASISFEWIGRGTQQPKASRIRGTADIEARNEAQRASDAVARQILEAAIRQRENAANSATKFTLGQLESLAEAPLELVDSMARQANAISSRVRRVGEVISTVRETPQAIAGRVFDVANNAVSVSTQFLDEMSREGPETQALGTKVSTLTRTASYYSGAQTQADLMSGAYADLAERTRRRRSAIFASPGASRGVDQMRVGDILDVHLGRAGETMASIARRYYEDADLADELCRANGLATYTIQAPVGQPLIIPVRRALDDSNRNRV